MRALTSIFCSCSTVWLATLMPLISLISSPTCNVPASRKVWCAEHFTRYPLLPFFSLHTKKSRAHSGDTLVTVNKPPWWIIANHNSGCWSVWLQGHESNTYLFIHWPTSQVEGFFILFTSRGTLREENKRCFCAVSCRFMIYDIDISSREGGDVQSSTLRSVHISLVSGKDVEPKSCGLQIL